MQGLLHKEKLDFFQQKPTMTYTTLRNGNKNFKKLPQGNLKKEVPTYAWQC